MNAPDLKIDIINRITTRAHGFEKKNNGIKRAQKNRVLVLLIRLEMKT